MPDFPPLPDRPPPFPAEPPLAAGLAELAPWWLEVRCGCGHVAFMPLRKLAGDLGWRTPLGSILPRLRCAKCRAEPASVDLIDDPQTEALGAGGGKGKRIKLRPDAPKDGPEDGPIKT